MNYGRLEVSDIRMAAASGHADFTSQCRAHLQELKQRCSRLIEQGAAQQADIVHNVQHWQTELTGMMANIPVTNYSQELVEWVRGFSRLVLDVTHVEETILVEEEFPLCDGVDRMNDVLRVLESPLRLEVGSENDINKLLGDEIVECIHWRRGALCYMYCATIAHDSERHKQIGDTFLVVAQNGISHLQHMLGVRKPLAERRSDVHVNCEQVFDLVAKGVYSDTHMLAIMYTGELCYWFLQHNKSDDKNVKRRTETIGRDQLQLYISLTEGPLRGWDSSRAKQLLAEL